VNTRLLSLEVQTFITQNLHCNLSQLILKGSPFEDVSIQEIAQQIEGKQKSLKKLPIWHTTAGVLFPKKINLEQSSSEATAAYKSKRVSGTRLVDLTGGFGVDCTFFSKSIDRVFHWELNPELSDLVKHNCLQMGIENIETQVGDGLQILKNSTRRYDWIYLDPSRRDEAKGKVFLIKDCLPNVPENIDFFFEYTDQILIKYAPMLDISSAIKDMRNVVEVHVVAHLNEVKEILFVLKKEAIDTIRVFTCNLLKNGQQNFNFSFESDCKATYGEPQTYLYEPNAALLKSGAFSQISQKFHLDKLHKHSHLYTSEALMTDFPGRTFKIKKSIRYNKKELLNLLPEQKANITTRNFPETVAQIRKKTKIKEGGTVYLFFTTDFKDNKIVLLCSKRSTQK